MFEDGVWRTIGGRRVFIRTGQSMSDAMRKSGKFNFKNKKMKMKKNDDLKQYRNEAPDDAVSDYMDDKGVSESEAWNKLYAKEIHDYKNSAPEDAIQDFADDYGISKEKASKILYGESLEDRVKRGIAGNQSDLVGKDREEQKAINKEYLKQSSIAKERISNNSNNGWNNRNSYKQGDTIEYDTKYPLGLTEKWKKGEVLEVKNDWASHGDTHPDKIYKVKDLENGNVYEVSAGAVSKKISSNSTNEGLKAQAKSGDDGNALTKSIKALNDIDKIAGDDEKLQRLGRSMGASSFARWNRAFNEYKKEHPNTKLDLYKFIKMNE